jgi:hypothetical protein
VSFSRPSFACSFQDSFRATSFREILLAPHRANAPVRQISSVKRTQSTRCDKESTLFLSACRISNCARTKCTGGNQRAGEQAVLGPTALVVRGQLHSPMGKLVMRATHVAPIRARCFNSKRTSFHVALELEHVESVNLRSAIREADAVLPGFACAGQRSDTLKRVAQRGRCRLLFLLGVQHIFAAEVQRRPLAFCRWTFKVPSAGVTLLLC